MSFVVHAEYYQARDRREGRRCASMPGRPNDAGVLIVALGFMQRSPALCRDE